MPGKGKNDLATLPGKGFFAIFRLYGPKKSFFDHSWKREGVVKMKYGNLGGKFNIRVIEDLTDAE